MIIGMEDEKDDFVFGADKEIFYSFEGGKFIARPDYHSEEEKIFMKQNWDLYKQRAEEARQKVIAGNASPIVYHMEKRGMELNVLASTVELPKWRVKRHLKMVVYKKLKIKIIEKYAHVFQISIEELNNIND